MYKGLYFSKSCYKYSKPPFKWFFSIRHGANNWETSGRVLMHVNSFSVTGFHSVYCPNVEVRVYDN